MNALRLAIMATMSLSITACVTVSNRAATTVPTTITIRHGGCLGPCPLYSVTLRADGSAEWKGESFVAAKDTRAIVVDRALYAQVARQLAAFRPRGTRDVAPGKPGCEDYSTHFSATTIRWSDAQRTDNLSYYWGCHGDNAALAQTLQQTLDMLPVADLIGPPKTFQDFLQGNG